MAFGVPPYTTTNTRRRSAPPTGTIPNTQPTTTTTAPPPPPPPPSPIPTGTIPNPQQPRIPNSPLNPNTPFRPTSGPPYQGQYPQPYQVPMIPYQDNALIPPTDWASRFPGAPYPTSHVSPQDANRVLLDQYAQQTADRLEQSQTSAGTLANQYDTWLRSTQSRALGQLVTGTASATGINDLNNRALSDSANNQLGLSNEQTYRNQLDQSGLSNSNSLINTQLGLAGQQRSADIGRIQSQWSLRNGQQVSDQDYIRGVWGRASEQLGADQAQSGAMADQARLGYGYASADLQNSTNRANLQESTNRRAATSAAAGAGAFGSAGFRDNISDVTELGSLNRESAWNTYERARDSTTGDLRDIDFGRGNLDRRYSGDVANYQKQLDDNDRNYQGDVVNFEYGIGQANREYQGVSASLQKALKDNTLARQGLESMARSYGIQREDIMQTLSTATERNNINLNQMLSEMNAAYAQGDQDRIFQFNQLLTNLMGM